MFDSKGEFFFLGKPKRYMDTDHFNFDATTAKSRGPNVLVFVINNVVY